MNSHRVYLAECARAIEGLRCVMAKLILHCSVFCINFVCLICSIEHKPFLHEGQLCSVKYCSIIIVHSYNYSGIILVYFDRMCKKL